MTMPHLGNCPHKPGTWCLPCVREEWERREAEADALRAKLSAAEARIGRLRRLALAHESPKRRGPSGGGTDYRLEEINRARVDCREHNDLTPPTADNNAAQPQKD